MVFSDGERRPPGQVFFPLAFLVVIPPNASMSPPASRVSFQLPRKIFPGPCSQITQAVYNSPYAWPSYWKWCYRNAQQECLVSLLPWCTLHSIWYFSALQHSKLMHFSYVVSSLLSLSPLNLIIWGSKFKIFSSIMQIWVEMKDMKLGKRSLEDSRSWGKLCHGDHPESVQRQLMQAAASLDTLCAPQVTGTRMWISTDCCFFMAGQKDCSGNMDCQALFPALTGKHVMLFLWI